jgi:hypothetical protein
MHTDNRNELPNADRFKDVQEYAHNSRNVWRRRCVGLAEY